MAKEEKIDQPHNPDPNSGSIFNKNFWTCCIFKQNNTLQPYQHFITKIIQIIGTWLLRSKWHIYDGLDHFK